MRFTCTARIANRERLATDALQIQGVVEVREMMTDRENIEVTAVAPRHEDLTDVAMALDELGLDIEREELIRHRFVRPFNHFGTEDMGDDEAATHDV